MSCLLVRMPAIRRYDGRVMFFSSDLEYFDVVKINSMQCINKKKKTYWTSIIIINNNEWLEYNKTYEL